MTAPQGSLGAARRGAGWGHAALRVHVPFRGRLLGAYLKPAPPQYFNLASEHNPHHKVCGCSSMGPASTASCSACLRTRSKRNRGPFVICACFAFPLGDALLSATFVPGGLTGGGEKAGRAVSGARRWPPQLSRPRAEPGTEKPVWESHAGLARPFWGEKVHSIICPSLQKLLQSPGKCEATGGPAAEKPAPSSADLAKRSPVLPGLPVATEPRG